MIRDALARLVAPLSPAEFLTFWMQRSVHIPGTAAKTAGLFDLDAFHAAVETAARRPDAARLGFDVRAGATRAISPAAISAEVAAGNTICVSAIHVGSPPLAALVAELKTQLAFPGHAAVNAYLSPRGSGFSFVHFDARIATTLQISGRKKWRYAERAALAWPRHNVRIAPDGSLDWHQPPAPWEARAGLPGELELSEVELAPGDVLCLPPGTFHAAEATDDLSLSLNLNFSYGGFFDVILPYLSAQLSALPAWREPPLPGADLPGYFAARSADLRRALDELAANAPLVWSSALHAPPAFPPSPPPVAPPAPTDTYLTATMTLLAAGERALVVSPFGYLELPPELARWLVERRRFTAGDAPGAWLEVQPHLTRLLALRFISAAA